MKWVVAGFILVFWVSVEPNTSRQYLVVWAVGQGQWITAIQGRYCLHFDTGGEFSPLQKVMSNCRFKKNSHLLSHYDWDHLAFLAELQRFVHLCRFGSPTEPKRSRQKRHHDRYQKMPTCSEEHPDVRELNFIKSGKSPNRDSRVFIYQNQFLLPGDSTSSEEKLWYPQVPRDLRVWVLGHHGSRTSSGLDLSAHIRPGTTAVASARKGRYGHPHHQVVHRLMKHHIPLLRTEDWGNLWFGTN